MIREYIHEKMNQEIETISGHYMFYKEVRLPFNNCEILYVVGCAVIDNSCCGVGGCGYALVPGYIVSWESRIDNQGRYVSEVEPIRDQSTQKEVNQLIKKTEIVTQVQFW
ncbi:hypothetical protein KA005_16600 [bacterium]|nr:hypothetical protein [bacterium]